jgi:hypothetical protein
MFPRVCFNADGRLRLKIAAPVNPSFNAGIPCGADFVYASNATPNLFVNGLPASVTTGQLSAKTNVTQTFQNGLPFDATGAVTYIAAAATSYQNGLPFNGSQLAVEIVP